MSEHAEGVRRADMSGARTQLSSNLGTPGLKPPGHMGWDRLRLSEAGPRCWRGSCSDWGGGGGACCPLVRWDRGQVVDPSGLSGLPCNRAAGDSNSPAPAFFHCAKVQVTKLTISTIFKRTIKWQLTSIHDIAEPWPPPSLRMCSSAQQQHRTL